MFRKSLITALLALTACGVENQVPAEDPTSLAQPLLALPLNLCGNAGTAPQVFSNTIMHPQAVAPGARVPTGWNAANGRATRGGVEYVSGDGLRFEMATDGCVFFKEVRLGSRVVTTTSTGGYWLSVQPSTSPPADPTKLGWNVWVFFPRAMDGTTERLTITLGRTAGTATTSTGLNLSRVEAVEGAETPARAAVSRTELQNMFGKAVAAKFNWPTNAMVLTDADGSKRTVYGYDPKSLVVSLDTTGIAFSFDFKAKVDNWCDPGVSAYGKFRVISSAGTLQLQWVTPAQATLHWPLRCELAALVPGLGLIPWKLFENAQSSASLGLRASLEQSINDALANSAAPNIFITGTTTNTSELDVALSLPLTSVVVRPPYDAFDLPANPMGFGSGQTVALFGTGQGVNDYIADITPQTTLWSGPNGVPRQGTTNWPQAWTLGRAGTLPWDTAPVARLLMRSTSGSGIALPTTTTWNYTPGCAIGTWERFGLFGLRFGVNDLASDAQRLRGIFGAAPGYHVRVMFLDDGGSTFTSGAKRCEARSSGAVISAALQ